MNIETMNLKKSKEGFAGVFEMRKGKGEMVWIYYVKNRKFLKIKI